MTKKFDKFKKRTSDSNTLLDQTLSTMVTEMAKYNRYKIGLDEFDREPVQVEIPLEHFEEKAKQNEVFQITDFLNSKRF